MSRLVGLGLAVVVAGAALSSACTNSDGGKAGTGGSGAGQGGTGGVPATGGLGGTPATGGLGGTSASGGAGGMAGAGGAGIGNLAGAAGPGGAAGIGNAGGLGGMAGSGGLGGAVGGTHGTGGCWPTPTTHNDPACPNPGLLSTLSWPVAAMSCPAGLTCEFLIKTGDPCYQPPLVRQFVCCGSGFVEGTGTASCSPDASADR
jgi:hypothetical protein